MFGKAILSFAIAALTSKVLASPLPLPRHAPRGLSSNNIPSFNDWPIQSLHGFDDFYGSSNFDGSNNKQTILSGQNVVCKSIEVKVIQQRLAVIQEIAKKVITELVCDVETQTVVWEQFYASMGSFGRDIGHQSKSSRQIGYDSNVISHFPKIINSDGSCSTDDFGFSGSSIGSSMICPSGNTWNDNTSPSSVGLAKYSCEKAIFGSQWYGSSSEDCSVESGNSISINNGCDGGSCDSSCEGDSCDSSEHFTTIDNSWNNNYYSMNNNYNTGYNNNYNTGYNNYYTTEYNNNNNYYTSTSTYSSYGSYQTSSSECEDCCDDCETSTYSSYGSYTTSSADSCDDCETSTYSSYGSFSTSSADCEDCCDDCATATVDSSFSIASATATSTASSSSSTGSSDDSSSDDSSSDNSSSDDSSSDDSSSDDSSSDDSSSDDSSSD